MNLSSARRNTKTREKTERNLQMKSIKVIKRKGIIKQKQQGVIKMPPHRPYILFLNNNIKSNKLLIMLQNLHHPNNKKRKEKGRRNRTRVLPKSKVCIT